ncbi:MAG: thermonuclease family protein [Rhodospirillaceae bacterium]|nr:thermonuclease family protein [Rhodospirillaceae bacterium]
MTTLKAFFTAALLVVGLAAHAASPDGLPRGEVGIVATVIDGDTVRLKDGSADIRLVGIQAPKLPLGRKGFKAWPLADEARQALLALTQDRQVTLRLGTTARDRNGRTLAHLVREDGVWIQGEMLRQGWARVYTFPDNRQLATELSALETEARDTKRGIWADEFYAVREAADAAALMSVLNTFQIVTGTVHAVAKTKERIYLNFGDDFRSDFTISVDKRDWPRFDDAKLDLSQLTDHTIEVHGWLVSRNGPMIEATHPEQIRVGARK